MSAVLAEKGEQEVVLLEELLRRQRARRSYADFCRYIAPDEPPGEHHLLITAAGDRIIAGELRRVLIMMPPGSAKSTYATVRLPPYFLGRLGRKGLITASWGDELAEMFGGRVRNIIASREFQNVFPGVQLSADTRAKGEWNTNSGGYFFAVGVGGGVAGRRADMGVIDDPFKNREDADSPTRREKVWAWYVNDFRTRLKPDATILLIQTRWHEDDLAGRILPEGWNGESGWVTARDGEQWFVICLPAQAREGDILGRAPGEWLWTDWFNEGFWEQTKKTALLHDVRTWNSLYQQTPIDSEGTFFQRSWFANRYDELPKHLNRFIAGDFATRDGAGDYTELGDFGVSSAEEVCVYVADWFSGQVRSDVWTEQLLTMADDAKALGFIGEMGPIRRAVEPWLEKRMRETGKFVRCHWLQAMSRESDSVNGKAAGARAFQALASQGRIRFPRTEWAERVIDQLCKFPAGTLDDAVDVCGLFGRFIANTWAAIEPEVPKTINWDAPMQVSEFLKPLETEDTW